MSYWKLEGISFLLRLCCYNEKTVNWHMGPSFHYKSLILDSPACFGERCVKVLINNQ